MPANQQDDGSATQQRTGRAAYIGNHNDCNDCKEAFFALLLDIVE